MKKNIISDHAKKAVLSSDWGVPHGTTRPRAGERGLQKAIQSLIERLEPVYLQLTEEEKKYLGISALALQSVFGCTPPRVRHLTTTPTDLPVRFVIRGLSFYLKPTPKSKLKEIPGFLGKVLLLALLQLRESKRLLWLWGFRFRARAQDNRLVRLNSDIKSEVANVDDKLDLRIEQVGGTDHLRIYELQWNRGVTVCDPVQRAASITKDAAKYLQRKDGVTAIRKAVRAVVACSLYFPAYQICLDCLRQYPALTKNIALNNRLKILMYASAEMQEWLEYLSNFNFGHIKKEFHDDIITLCIAQNTARLAAIDDLRKRITDSESAITLPAWRNPANLVLNESREATLNIVRGCPVFKSVQATSDYQRLLDATLSHIEDSDQYQDVLENYGIGEAGKLLQRHLVVNTLVELAAQDKSFYFPEPSLSLPDDAVDTATIDKTAIELSKRVLKTTLG